MANFLKLYKNTESGKILFGNREGNNDYVLLSYLVNRDGESSDNIADGASMTMTVLFVLLYSLIADVKSGF
jgi:hypothetical protein